MSSKLKEARLKAGYSIEEVSEKLNIRKQYLIGLEEENFDSMPGKIYIDGYTRLYAKFLGIDEDYPSKKEEEVKIVKVLKVKNRSNSNYQKYIILIALAILILIFGIYDYLGNHFSDEEILDQTKFMQDDSNETTIIGYYNSD